MDPGKRLVAGLAAIAAIIAVAGLLRIASQPAMALLYAGLEPGAAGEVVTALESRGVAYEVRGDAIYVPESERDRLRMSLAAEGRPSGGAAGYELLDDLSGFGTTSEMFDAAYWRAKEGELARTILALPGVRRARVHIANPARKPFERRVEPTASVTVAMRSGVLGKPQAQAIRHLVSSAVAGLQPEAVTVVDAEGGVILAPGKDAPAQGAGSIAEEKAAILKANVERLLAARVGEGAAVVEVSVETRTESEKVTERVLDPQSRVAIHSDTEETNESETGTTANVTVASNLPDGDANGGGQSKRNAATTRERMNYDVSEVLRERVTAPGAVTRISVAVLVDGIRTVGPDGQEVWTPRPKEELDALRELVQTAVGFDPSRGDVVSIESMEFARPAEQGVAAEADAVDFLAANAMTLIQLGVLSAVALALGLLVLRPMITAPAQPRLTEINPSGNEQNAPALPGQTPDVAGSLEAAGEVIDARNVAVDHVEALRKTVEARKEDATLVLRSWLETAEAEGERA
nr:flagellar basal-body MS-ring/collar protein FliF [Oceanicella actignis]